MTELHYILATAGHVDHGKSALVKALTGIDPDRLPEEKHRGITIDLGFAHLELPDPTNPDRKFVLGLIDVPGHEDFVKNMVAGVGSIDLALLVVAADDAWMPQTEEHLQILNYLGVQRAVVALTKIDLAPGRENERIETIRSGLEHSPLAQAPIVATSVLTGRGLDQLKTELANVLARTPRPADIGKPRLPVDRVFILRGVGTIVTGTLSGGVLRRGQTVLVQPGARTGRIRSLQSHNREVASSEPGTRTGLSLPDLSGHDTRRIERGDVITLPELAGNSEILDAMIFKSKRLEGLDHGAARPLTDGARVKIHHGTSHFAARIQLVERREIGPGETGLARLGSESPVFALAGDRFIIRDWSERWTLGGGIILDPAPGGRRAKDPAQVRFLQTAAAGPFEPRVMACAQIERDLAVRREALLVKSRFSAGEIFNAVRALMAEGQVAAFGGWLVDGAAWRRIRKEAVERIDAEHRARPQQLGLALNELRAEFEKRFPAKELFDGLMADLVASGFAQTGAFIRRASHRPALPPHLQSAGVKVRAALSAKPFEPPSKQELAPDPAAQQALKFLLETGEAVEIGEGLALLSENAARMTEIIRRTLQKHGRATASELRQAVGASRRIVIPLLEKLDRDGLTRREGDWRVLRKVEDSDREGGKSNDPL